MKSIKPPKRPNPRTKQNLQFVISREPRLDGAVVTRVAGFARSPNPAIYIPRKPIALPGHTLTHEETKGGLGFGGMAGAHRRPVNLRAARNREFKHSFGIFD